MKKIFAIALALVMVLSMASAFASPCMGGFDWTKASATNCGKAKIEVVPYVKVSNGCGGFKWEVSECAGSVKTENVYFAVKMTVDANPDKEWFDEAKAVINTKGLTTKWPKDALLPWNGVKYDTTAETVYYYNFKTDVWGKVGTETGEISVADDVESTTVVDNYIKGWKVNDSSIAKVCVTLTSKKVFQEGVVGEYYVVYTKAEKAVAATKATLTYEVVNPDLSKYAVFSGSTQLTDWAISYANGKIVATAPEAKAETAEFGLYELQTGGWMLVAGAESYAGSDASDAAYATLKVFDKKGDAAPLAIYYIGANDKVVAVDYTNAGSCTPNDMASIKAFFGIAEGTAITQKLLNSNFGWDDKQEDCFKWNAASAIVDAECVVAIPKTGDASVLAWLF